MNLQPTKQMCCVLDAWLEIRKKLDMSLLENVRGLRAFRALGLLLVLAPVGGSSAQVPVHTPASPYVEEMTWQELSDRVAAGTNTVLVPIGGTEQSGPHMVLGKHNVRARLLAGRIAERLGNAVVAPVIAYVPEGSINPPAGHMRFSGTISVPDTAFESVLEGAARSFCQHGIRNVFFLGDHGGYQRNEEKVAARMSHAGTGTSRCHVHALAEYYDATQASYIADLKGRGFSSSEIGTHAGLADTALSLALDPSLVRSRLMNSPAAKSLSNGVHGDPAHSSAELGQLGVQRIIETSVKAIRSAVGTEAAAKPSAQPEGHKESVAAPVSRPKN